MTEKANGWVKFLLALLPVLVAFLVGWGALNAKVGTLSERVNVKADKAVVDVQYDAILRELRTMNQRLDRIEVRR